MNTHTHIICVYTYCIYKILSLLVWLLGDHKFVMQAVRVCGFFRAAIYIWEFPASMTRWLIDNELEKIWKEAVVV
jgi:hypothetical protein